ncbi:HNH endonuclease signature motif containing protein [Anaeromyxobacter diazotrophicus]|uniref:HNH endonuclease signature motif containing protein n=1 Tax=Anaeromyxobacter diazotrophicus TaxID=2590199 RepID=UPI001F1853B0|nr:HNH endonuclease signature motif containing protein [Anaeromyxobacter diazotrophicus]
MVERPTSRAGSFAATYAPPRLALDPFTPGELYELFRGGELDADQCEGLLAWAARYQGALEVSIAEGLDALRRGDRLAQLASHLDDYAREVLGLRKRAAQALARLGRELRTRPLLREAMRAGRVRLRAAQTILGVAVGEAEAAWVERAEHLTVRQLEAAVRRAGAAGEEEDEPWLPLGAQLRPDEREAVDEALALAGELAPELGRVERLEVLAQEYLGEHPTDVEPDPARTLGGALRTEPADAARRAALEDETERWAALRRLAEVPAPDVRFSEIDSAQEIDRVLRQLARARSAWDDILGYCAAAIRKGKAYQLLGFTSFKHYCEERLGLASRAVEQRARTEERRWLSPALQDAHRQGLPFEKLRLLSRLPEPEIARWIPRAQALTCVALRRELEGEAERQMRARRSLAVPLPLRIAALLAAAVQVVRERAGAQLGLGACLATIARHFIATWRGSVKRSRSRSRKVRDRDGWCQVPGCSHRATQAHHVLFRSHGGGDELDNQVGLCAFHHLRCIHGGYLRVVGRAPDELRWFLKGQPWSGPRSSER